jgi:hypothetical protein
MKRLSYSCIIMVLVFMLAGCSVISPTVLPTMVKSPTIATILLSQTLTPTATITPIPSKTPLNMLEPNEAEEAIRKLLQEPVDCAAPCFWGITPGKTTLEEAGEIFGHLRLPLSVPNTYRGKDHSSTSIKFDSGLELSMYLTIHDKVVENIHIRITPEKQEFGTSREWSAYSPETLIERYGPPTRVDFGVDWGPYVSFAMQIYYDELDLIIQYYGDNIIPGNPEPSLMCPLVVKFDAVWFWLGKNPYYPPGLGVPLDVVTSLTIDEFAQLMIGEPDNACFVFDGNAYPIER